MLGPLLCYRAGIKGPDARTYEIRVLGEAWR
jgi:hypothetical protein